MALMAKRVKIETPCAGHPPRWLPARLARFWEYFERRVYNELYTERCVRDSLLRGEAPYSSQLLYDRDHILNDAILRERTMGMDAGLAWTERADLVAVYCDHGISRGMQEGIKFARERGTPVEMRYIMAPKADVHVSAEAHS